MGDALARARSLGVQAHALATAHRYDDAADAYEVEADAWEEAGKPGTAAWARGTARRHRQRPPDPDRIVKTADWRRVTAQPSSDNRPKGNAE